MKWWTAEEERIRVENEAVAASLLEKRQGPKDKRQQRGGGGGRRGKTLVHTADDGVPSGKGHKASRGGSAGEGERRAVGRG